MSEQLENLDLERNNLYRDNYRRVMKLLVIMVIIGLGLLAILSLQIYLTPIPKYFATTRTGRVVPLQSLDMPVVTNDYLLQWAVLAARTSYNLDFENYPKQLKVAQPYFTENGWNSFISAMRGSLSNIKDNKLFMSAVASGPPVILSRSVVHGRYTWQVQLPLLVTYTSANDKRKANFTVTMNIIRIPVIEAEKSIEINNFVATRKR